MMTVLVLMITFPIVVGVLVAGWLGRHRSPGMLWLALAVTGLAAVTPWIALSPPGSSAMQRFGAPIAAYLPALLLAGIAFAALGRSRWTPKTVRFLAFGTAIVNVLLSQFVFVLGCNANYWTCQ